MKNPSPKEVEETTSAFRYPGSEKLLLQRPQALLQNNFFDLVHQRQSDRKFKPLLAQQLEDLLWYSAKILKTFTQKNGYILSHRPSPSAGARHPIDIIVAKPNNKMILEYYNPFDHSLNPISIDYSLVSKFINHVNKGIEIQQGTLIWFLAYPDRTTAKYNHAESLIWRDAGALIYCIQLTCTALNLLSCPVGTLAEPFITNLFSKKVLSAGGIIIGGT